MRKVCLSIRPRQYLLSLQKVTETDNLAKQSCQTYFNCAINTLGLSCHHHYNAEEDAANLRIYNFETKL